MINLLLDAFKYLITPYRFVDWLWKPLVLGAGATACTTLVHMAYSVPLGLPFPDAYFFITAISLPFFLMGMGLAGKIVVLHGELRRMALTDALTGLDNRLALFQNVAGKQGSILMVDADHFKSVNDTHGHDVGDEVLIKIARHLEGSMAPDDQAARLGGDEFVVFLNVANEDRALVVGTKISKGVDVAPAGRVTLSVGAVTAQHWQGDMTAAIKKADEALYLAKGAGQSCVVFWKENGVTPRVPSSKAERRARR